MIVRTAEKQTLSQILGLTSTLDNRCDTTAIEQNDQAFKLINRIWQLYTRTLRTNVIDKNHFTHCKVLGSFSHLKNIQAGGSTKICFLPPLDSIEAYKFDYEARPPLNMDTISFESLLREKILDQDCTVYRINYH